MRQLFVYYKVAAEREHEAQAAVAAVQGALMREHAGLVATLMRRPEPSDGFHTWMEIYAVENGSVSEAIEQAIERAAAVLAPLIHGKRHGEVFITCAC